MSAGKDREHETWWAVVDRFGNSTVGLDRCVSVHRSEDRARAVLERMDRAVRRGHGPHARSGWRVTPVRGGTRKGDLARRVEDA